MYFYQTLDELNKYLYLINEMVNMSKRRYTHIKDRVIPVEHGSIIDETDHTLSPEMGSYKTKKKSWSE